MLVLVVSLLKSRLEEPDSSSRFVYGNIRGLPLHEDVAMNSSRDN